jgi:hypothetical protein
MPRMRRLSKPIVPAALLSFSIYLLPLIGPHAATLLGQALISELTRDTNRSPVWIATDIGLALLLQAAAMAILYRLFRKFSLIAGVVTVIAIPIFIGFAEVSYLVAIPSIFLIERDTMSESANWPVACSAANASLIAVPMSQMRLRQDIPSFPVQSSDGRYHMMRFSDCSVQPLSLPQPTLQPGGQRVDFTVGINYFVSEAGLLFHKLPVGTTKMEWGLLKHGVGTPIALDIPSSIPVLSSDAASIGWVELSEGSGPRPSHLIVRRIESDRPSVEVDLSRYGLSNEYTLIGLDILRAEALLARNEYSKYVFLTVDFDGRQQSATDPDGVKPQPQTFLKLPDGWIAWDAYQERDAYRVRWSLAAGQGSHRVSLGRGIIAVATNPSGSLIAISVSTNLNIGKTPDAVYILRAADGLEIFRKYLPRYSRSNVVFPSDDLFAYSTDGTTIVLHVPKG